MNRIWHQASKEPVPTSSGRCQSNGSPMLYVGVGNVHVHSRWRRVESGIDTGIFNPYICYHDIPANSISKQTVFATQKGHDLRGVQLQYVYLPVICLTQLCSSSISTSSGGRLPIYFRHEQEPVVISHESVRGSLRPPSCRLQGLTHPLVHRRSWWTTCNDSNQ